MVAAKLPRTVMIWLSDGGVENLTGIDCDVTAAMTWKSFQGLGLLCLWTRQVQMCFPSRSQQNIGVCPSERAEGLSGFLLIKPISQCQGPGLNKKQAECYCVCAITINCQTNKPQRKIPVKNTCWTWRRSNFVFPVRSFHCKFVCEPSTSDTTLFEMLKNGGRSRSRQWFSLPSHMVC